jgi:anti-sigma B factor antagonist
VGLQISVRERGDVSILDLRGRSTIDEGESELLGSHLKKLIDKGVCKLLLNLADLARIDSSGIGVIVATCIAARRMGGDLKLLCPSGRVLEVLTVVHLLDVIPSFENEALALASFGTRGYFATP